MGWAEGTETSCGLSGSQAALSRIRHDGVKARIPAAFRSRRSEKPERRRTCITSRDRDSRPFAMRAPEPGHAVSVQPANPVPGALAGQVPPSVPAVHRPAKSITQPRPPGAIGFCRSRAGETGSRYPPPCPLFRRVAPRFAVKSTLRVRFQPQSLDDRGRVGPGIAQIRHSLGAVAAIAGVAEKPSYQAVSFR